MKETRVFIIRQEVYNENGSLKFVKNVDACLDAKEATKKCQEKSTGSLLERFTFDSVVLN